MGYSCPMAEINDSSSVEGRASILSRLANLRLSDSRTWLAIADDQLGQTIPEDSKSMARFRELRTEAENALSQLKEWEDGSAAVARCRAFVSDVAEATPYTSSSSFSIKDDLEGRVDRIIQKGYFRSIYFRAIAALFTLLLLLITGVGGLNIYEQVQAMQKKLDEARANVERSNVEISKARSETSDRQAQLALLVLEGNEDMVKMRTNAITEMAKTQEAARAEVNIKAQDWTDKIEREFGPQAEKRVIDAGTSGKNEVEAKAQSADSQIEEGLKNGRTALADKLKSALGQLEAVKNPWVPRVVWSMAKEWLLVPFTLVISLLAFVNSASHQWKSKGLITRGVVVLDVIVIVGGFVLLSRIG
jgi:hypothetical protein